MKVLRTVSGWMRRRGIWIGLAAAVCAGCLLVREVRRFGSPHFAFSPGTTADEALPVQEPVPGVDLATTRAADSPGFLGANRDGAVRGVELEPDWTAHPPRLLWRKPIGAGWSSFAIVNGFAVTMEQRGPEEQVTCYEVASGRHRWSAAWPERFVTVGVGPRSTPTIVGGHVFALGAWGHLVCLDGANGSVVWERELMRDLGLDWQTEHDHLRFGRANAPLVTGGCLVLPGGGEGDRRATLLGYDVATGAPRWRGGSRSVSYSSPVRVCLLGEAQVLSVNEDTVTGHDAATGAERWCHGWSGDSGTDANVSQPIVIASNRVLLTKAYGRGAEVIELVKRPDGAIRTARVWARHHVLQTKFSTALVVDGFAYGLSNGSLECVDLADGALRWRAGRFGDGQLLRIGTHLLILDDTGGLSLVRADPAVVQQPVARLQALNGTTWNVPAFSAPYLLVRNAAEAACYELAICGPASHDAAP